MESVKPFVKFAVRLTHLEMIPFNIAKAFRMATFGRPGPVYIELPGDLLMWKMKEKDIKYIEYH